MVRAYRIRDVGDVMITMIVLQITFSGGLDLLGNYFKFVSRTEVNKR